uniref:Uncharacterized protein n=1 Tax=Eptatretus burgeri TaxID=7764 RepID=A0A8C4RAB0_EPTBU
MNSHFLGDPAKKGAVITIQSGYRGYRARKDLKTKHQSATTIQANYCGYQTRKYLKNIGDGNDMVTFQDEPTHNKVPNQVHSLQSSSLSSQGHSSRTRSCSPGPKCDLDSALEVERRVQIGKVIQPRVDHDGGTTSRDMSLIITKKMSPQNDDVVFSHGLETSGINSHFLVYLPRKGQSSPSNQDTEDIEPGRI